MLVYVYTNFQMKKIAFLFITTGDIHFSEIWDYYFANNSDKYSIYCHPKYPDKVITPWLKNNIINNLVETKWGHLTNAYVSLLDEAIKDPDNVKFMFVSESCLPIKKFNLFYNMVIHNNVDKSYVQFMKMDKWKKDNLHIFEKITKIKLIKHSGWFCLSRLHAMQILNFKFVKNFDKITAGDENILSIITNDKKNIINFEITYTNWTSIGKQIDKLNEKIKELFEKHESTNISQMKEINDLRQIKYDLSKHPYTFNKISPKMIRFLKKSKSFFCRKFSSKSNIIDHYKELI